MKSQARRHGGNAGLPGWAWLVIGVLVTLLVVLMAPRLLRGGSDGFLRPTANPDALPPPVADGEAIAPDAAPAGDTGTRSAPKAEDRTNYDFYTLLPGPETQMTDAELAASAREEAEAQQRAAAAAAAAATGATPTLPDPVDTATPGAAVASTGAVPPPGATGTPAPSTTPARPAATPAAGDSRPATSAAAPAAQAADTEARYILQAGAFGASGDAEAVKARIAMLGLNARVESAQINGRTVYRVRMGPYGSATELSDAKAKLSSGGLPAIAVKSR